MTLSRETTEFFDERLVDLAKQVRRKFVFLISDTSAEDVRGFGLTLDATGTHLVAGLLRVADLDEMQTQVEARLEGRAPDRDWELFWRWHPEAWPRNALSAPDDRARNLDELWADLVERRAVSSGADQQYWPSVLFETAANAMALLFRDGFFDEYPHAHQVVRVLDDVDGERPVDQDSERRWVQQCNDPVGQTSFAALTHRTGVR